MDFSSFCGILQTKLSFRIVSSVWPIDKILKQTNYSFGIWLKVYRNLTQNTLLSRVKIYNSQYKNYLEKPVGW